MFAEVGAPHHLPHFHANHDGVDAVYAIRDGEIVRLSGALPSREDRLVLAWAEIHKSEIGAAWKHLISGGGWGKELKIKPLE